MLNKILITHDVTYHQDEFPLALKTMTAYDKQAMAGFFLYKADYWTGRNNKKFVKASTKSKEDIIRGIKRVLSGRDPSWSSSVVQRRVARFK